MARKRSPLPLEVLSFLLATLLELATGNLTKGTGPRPDSSQSHFPWVGALAVPDLGCDDQ